MPQCAESDIKQYTCIERGASSMSLPAMGFRTPLGAGFSDKYHVSPLSILGQCFDVVYLDKALHLQMLHLAYGDIEYLVGGIMAMCTISAMRRIDNRLLKLTQNIFFFKYEFTDINNYITNDLFNKTNNVLF